MYLLAIGVRYRVLVVLLPSNDRLQQMYFLNTNTCLCTYGRTIVCSKLALAGVVIEVIEPNPPTFPSPT